MHLLEGLLGLQLGNEVVHLFALTTGQKDVRLVDVTNVLDESLRVMSAKVDGHEDLLLKVVVV